uniref:Caspase recruitment domain family, member 11 n=1 Tax=Neogobius melanostomus TaxID=47308 RepID=A0A8C6S8E9_9GOBI
MENGQFASEEECLWDKVDYKRNELCRSISPSKLTPYLRQCKVLDEQDEDEVLNSLRLVCNMWVRNVFTPHGNPSELYCIESLNCDFPIRPSAGHPPNQRTEGVCVEEGHEGLVHFLMNEVMKLQAQSKAKTLQQAELRSKNCTLEDEQKKLRLANQELQAFQQRFNKLKEERNAYSDELLRVKDENYKLAMRYAALSEEKNMAVMRSRDLQLEIDQLKHRLNKLEEECRMERRQSLKLKNDIENRPKREQIHGLERENEMLKIKVQELQSIIQPDTVPASDKTILDILEHDRLEALEDRQDLVNRLYNLQEEVRQAEELRDKYLEEKEELELKCSTLQKDCEMYHNRMDTITIQLDEVEKERDQAFRARDDAQHQFSQCLIDKDKYRKQIRDSEEKSDELQIEIVHKDAKIITLESRLRRLTKEHGLDQIDKTSPAPCQSEWSSDDSPEEKFFTEEPRFRRRLNIKAMVNVHSRMVTFCSSKMSVNEIVNLRGRNDSILSTHPEPPDKNSLYRREKEKECDFYDEVYHGPASVHSSSSSHQSESMDAYDLEQVNTIFRKFSLERPFRPSLSSITRMSSTLKPVQEVSLLGDNLLKDITLVGGNDSGIFISSVQAGSGAEKAGLREGHHLLMLEGDIRGENQSVSLDTSTQEEAHWTLQHCSGPVKLHYRSNNDEGHITDGTLASGDSFYIRVNLNISNSENGSLNVRCDEVVHVLDTHHQERTEWLCARVDPYTGLDLPERGTVPCNSRAQQLLLVKIQKLVYRGGKEESDISRNTKNNFLAEEPSSSSDPKAGPRLSKASIFLTQIIQFVSRVDIKYKRMNSNERVRLVNSGGTLPRQSFEMLRSEDNEFCRSLNLIPYSPVTPQKTQRKRPVLITPVALARTIVNKMLTTSGATDFSGCKPETFTKDEFQLKQNIEPFIHYTEKQAMYECITRENIEDVAAKGKHCLVEAELSCVKDLLRREIYPIIIYIKICERNIKRLRKLPVRVEPEDEFVRLCRAKEKELEGIPCLYASLEPDTWTGLDDLVKVIKERIVEEQKKTIWVEQDLL